MVSGLLIVLLIIAYFDMPYGYYQFLRLSSTVGFSFLAYHEWKHDRLFSMVIFIGLIILFQPFQKIALGRAGWEIANGIVAGLLSVYVFYLLAATKVGKQFNSKESDE
mgnify:CR=1 FL=1